MEVVIVGPWGSSDGKSWFYNGKGKMKWIDVSHGEYCINGIYLASENDGCMSHFCGTNCTSVEVWLELDTDVEELNCISGTIGYLDSKMVVTSLSFSTNLNKFGPFGKENGTHFSLPISKGRFVGFFGHSDAHLSSIGAFLVPT